MKSDTTGSRLHTNARVLAIAITIAALCAAPATAKVRTERIEVRGHDGTVLRGFVQIPDGAGVPVVLFSSPYDGTLDPGVEDPVYSSAPSGRPVTVPVARLLAEGYAVANVNVRGTGQSGGCFELFGRREQRDQKLLVDHLAGKSWSSGRVAMMGVSYDGTTPLEAAVMRPKALRAIAISGVISDLYTAILSPQGAPYDDQWPALGLFYVGPQLVRRHTPANAAQGMIDQLGVAHDRLCPELVRWMRETATGFAAGRRDREFYEARNFLARLHRVKAAVLLAHGLQDHVALTEDTMFARLTGAPKRYLAGQWVHGFPPPADLPDWEDRVVAFFDHFVKGRGARPADGVEYQEEDGRWHAAKRWPPEQAVDERLPLRAGSFRAAPDRSQASVTASAREMRDAYGPPCPGIDDATALMTVTPPLPASRLIAGNPSATIDRSSDRPAGRFSLRLYELAAGFDCLSGYRFLTEGVVDLRFVADRYASTPFKRATIHVDLANLAERIAPGSRIMAVLSLGPQKAGLGTREFANLTVHRGEVTLPTVP